eukprot:TRINITY_DN16782_c0_g1_i1.p1 TRINITY_DN16782_c0_g1~~TRINITY_DN16782_c0_g1_i1.p1  ORF type:complete len:1130 (-),score=219.78 TRINITY_DN16782_c0_g1_i1:230-3619(-)
MAAVEVSDEELEAFLKGCTESGNAAYSKLKELLERLNDPSTRVHARRLLTAVERRVVEEEKAGVKGFMAKYHFRIHTLTLSDMGASHQTLSDGQNLQTLTLLEMASIFIPEEWSFTFYEGLCRHPDAGFRDRDIVELGCGNGWVSIAMAARYSAKKVYGLDINPRAIKVAWINLYLNALGPDGAPKYDHEGKTLLDRVEFYVSDLLAYIRENNIKLDRVVGCIPQVLSPDPDATLKIVSETMSEEFLYSLSNYCGLQGLVEDQFGLGLIARAVEEAIEVIKPLGAVILNMGGRPGQAVCERLFLRRGFHIQKLWQTRVNQAADTDILALVEIERRSRHRFEFFMGPVSEEPISARSAFAFAKAGGGIAHGLTVYECRLQQTNHVKAIYKFLSQPGYDETRSALDLAFENQSVADEKTAFLAHLARSLESVSHLRSEPPAGSERFRAQIAAFLRLYFRIPLSAQNLVIVPSRAVAIESLVRLFSPRLALVDASLTRFLPRAWVTAPPDVTSTAGETPLVLEAPRRTDLVLRLARALRPQLLVVALADFEMRTATAFEQLLSTTAELGMRLFLDISDHLELSSQPGTNGVLQYLWENPLPPHAAILCGMVKNQVYADLEVGFVISESQTLLSALASAGDLSFSRTGLLPQLFYSGLLHELLSFQIPDRHQMAERLPKEEDSTMHERFVGFTNRASAAFRHPAIARIHQIGTEGDSGIVRMDRSQNSLPSPAAVKQFVFEGFGRQNISEAEMDPRPEILQLLSKRLGLSTQSIREVHLSDGTSSLSFRLMAACAEEGGTLVHPVGFVGSLRAMALMCGVSTKEVQTEEKDAFKLNKEQLSGALAGVLKPWLALSAPVVNPTGAIYTQAELTDILTVCREAGVRVVLSSTYLGLEFAEENAAMNLDASVASDEEGSRFGVAILGEISKELSAGGLAVGFAAVSCPFLAEGFNEMGASKPHGTLRYAFKKILALLCQGGERSMASELAQQRRVLKQRCTELCRVLRETGWEPLEPQGGLFVVAKPSAYKHLRYRLPPSSISRLETRPEPFNSSSVSLPDSEADQGGNSSTEVSLDGAGVVDVLYHTVKLAVNSSAWTSLPDGYCRFLISLDERDFVEGLKRLREFHDLLLSKGV